MGALSLFPRRNERERRRHRRVVTRRGGEARKSIGSKNLSSFFKDYYRRRRRVDVPLINQGGFVFWLLSTHTGVSAFPCVLLLFYEEWFPRSFFALNDRSPSLARRARLQRNGEPRGSGKERRVP